ncbi:MAG: hypothetical protein ABJA80_11885 [bacterium]
MLVALLGTTAVTLACGGANGDGRESTALPEQDSVATAREVHASLSGQVAPGAQSYSFRGLYAGMTRGQVGALVDPSAAVSASACHDIAAPANGQECAWTPVLGSDSAKVGVDVVFGPEAGHGERVARVITVTRELPLDVDGVQLARALSDAFAAQTALLDKRDASYGRHEAEVRMGTVNGARKNFVDLTVAPHAGRELLTVRLSRP